MSGVRLHITVILAVLAALFLMASSAQARVRGCRVLVEETQLVTSARNMSCASAARDLRLTGYKAERSYRSHGGFHCRRLSGTDLSNTVRCERGVRAYRYAFGD